MAMQKFKSWITRGVCAFLLLACVGWSQLHSQQPERKDLRPPKQALKGPIAKPLPRAKPVYVVEIKVVSANRKGNKFRGASPALGVAEGQTASWVVGGEVPVSLPKEKLKTIPFGLKSEIRIVRKSKKELLLDLSIHRTELVKNKANLVEIQGITKRIIRKVMPNEPFRIDAKSTLKDEDRIELHITILPVKAGEQLEDALKRFKPPRVAPARDLPVLPDTVRVPDGGTVIVGGSKHPQENKPINPNARGNQ